MIGLSATDASFRGGCEGGGEDGEALSKLLVAATTVGKAIVAVIEMQFG